MERNKSSKESQSQFLKEVLADFDIETHVNRIALRCFNDLLKSNKQAFDVLAESQKKIVQFQTRLCRTEGFTQSIEKNVSSKIEIANNLNRRLETFSTEFYAALKENESVIQLMRKDYDSLINSTQKNTYELRNLGDSLKKSTQQIESMETHVQAEISSFSFKINEIEIKSEKQLIEIRLECERLRESLTEARTHFLSKSGEFQEISKDITLYKFEKDSINRRLTDIMGEVGIKLNKSQFNATRLILDSRMVTDQENNLKLISDLRGMIKEEKEQRKADVKNIINESTTHWKEQEKTNLSLHSRVSELREELATKIEKIASKQQFLEVALRKEIELLTKRQEKDMAWVREQLRSSSIKIQQNTTKICDCEKFMQERYEETMELSSSVNSVGERLDAMIKENEQRRKEMTRIETTQNQSKLGESVSSLNDIIAQLQDQIFDSNKSIAALAEEVAEVKTRNQTRNEQLKSQIEQQQRGFLNLISLQKTQTQNRFTEINRHINDVSIQIMNNLHTVELTSKKYVDEMMESIRAKLEFLDQVNQQIKDLKQAFEEQMKETQAINQSITEKMEKANAGMTKFKSDLSLRVEAISNEQQRRSLEMKELVKQVEDMRKHLGYITEGVCVCLGVIAHREFLEDNQGIKDIKISSLLEGWVLEIDEKQAKYRGQHLQRRKLVVGYLNFLIFHSDKIKGTLIESGKDIYIRMLEESQQIFTTRKKGLSKKLGSELPKLHL